MTQRSPSFPIGKNSIFLKLREKGKPFGKRIFDLPAFTRIAEWGKAFKTLTDYVVQNVMEASGLTPYQPRKPRRGACLPKRYLRE